MFEQYLGKHVICTTSPETRGVFFAELSEILPINEGANPAYQRVTLVQARMVVYWSRETHGVTGLAADGPQDGCRIAAPVPSIELPDVHCVIECTPEAIEQFAGYPWER